MVNPIKKVFFDFVDKTMTQQGLVTSVKKWAGSGMYEVHVRLPQVDMNKWKTIPRIKVKVAEFEYRDYSPALWCAADHTCCLLIDARHNGIGSLWTQQLEAQQMFLFAAASTAALPAQKGPVLCLGDESALGHFLALKQLTNQEEYPVQTLISMKEGVVVPQEITSANQELQFIYRENAESLIGLHASLAKLNLNSFRSIYLAGNMLMVQRLRKILKADEQVNARIIANGFWS